MRKTQQDMDGAVEVNGGARSHVATGPNMEEEAEAPWHGDDERTGEASAAAEATLSSLHCSSTQSISGTSSTEDSSNPSYSREETKAVKRSKFLVYVALLCAACGITIATYFLVSAQEQSTFEEEFRRYAKELHDVAEAHAHNAFGQMHSLSTDMTSYARSNRRKRANASSAWWPFVTLRHFDLRTTETEMLSGAETIVFAPIVGERNRSAWEDYSWREQGWIAEDLKYRGWEDSVYPGNISKTIYSDQAVDGSNVYKTSAIYAPIWQVGPVPLNASIVNLDMNAHPSFHRMIQDVFEIEHVILSEALDVDSLTSHASANDGHPRSYVLQPVFDDFFVEGQPTPPRVVGLLAAVLPWRSFFVDVLPEGVNGLDVDVRDTCGSEFTYEILGHAATFFGQGDLHDPKYEHLMETFEFAKEARYDGDQGGATPHCEYTIRIFPSDTFAAPYHTGNAWLYSLAVLMAFLVTILSFAFNDYLVEQRQRAVSLRIKHVNNVIGSLFPKSLQKRIAMTKSLPEDAAEEVETSKLGFQKRKTRAADLFSSSRKDLTDYLGASLGQFAERKDADILEKRKPIADLYVCATVLFADLVGFTAWSSTRSPEQVLTLLETVFHHFDEIARRRRVFKVETVQDTYVAVAGLPEPRRDHATVMARFATDIMLKFHSLTRQLEVTLGPDTGELALRIGLHSGPVTAGILRVERARFQIFGDTVNTTSRIESSGASNRIHISCETATLLSNSGKSHWLQPRQDRVVTKGKGELLTYWLDLRGGSGDHSSQPTSGGGSSAPSSATSMTPSIDHQQQKEGSVAEEERIEKESEKKPKSRNKPTKKTKETSHDRRERLIDWNRDILLTLLQKIVARREALGTKPDPPERMRGLEQSKLLRSEIVLEEVQEVITLPKFDTKAHRNEKPAADIQLSHNVAAQLRQLIQIIASMYRDNPFHNFDHASHVTMSVVKLLRRIASPEMEEARKTTRDRLKKQKSKRDLLNKHQDGSSSHFDDTEHAALHDHTYGITSDPLTQFAVVLSAMIHDVDHPGVPNSQLVKEGARMAVAYKNQSVAEQNSLDLAWDLLMDPSFDELRRTIYATKQEFVRFRQIVVNTVMATDIMDKDLGALRKARWNRAFSEQAPEEEEEDVSVNRKATIVIEHLIQASDVAHTMQHWQIYRKWNARLFAEMSSAWREGRAGDTKDPASFWYQGELAFLNHYVIPLARKLDDCGVFGVSSDEYLSYALANRDEWERRGQAMIAEMLEEEEESHQ